MVTKSKVDIGSSNYYQPKNTEELVKYFDDSMNEARNALQNISDEAMAENFNLTNEDQILFTARKDDSVSSTINHWVHHRGQLTVYMRLNNIPVPSIYGPSADDKGF